MKRKKKPIQSPQEHIYASPHLPIVNSGIEAVSSHLVPGNQCYRERGGYKTFTQFRFMSHMSFVLIIFKNQLHAVSRTQEGR